VTTDKKKVTVFWCVMPCSLVNSSTLHGITSQKTVFFRNYSLYICYSFTSFTKFCISSYTFLVLCAVHNVLCFVPLKVHTLNTDILLWNSQTACQVSTKLYIYIQWSFIWMF